MYIFIYICTQMYTILHKNTKKINTTNMHSHIKKAYDFLDAHLPFNYTKETHEILKKANIFISSEVIRNVRTKKSPNNIHVLNALLKVAKKNQKSKAALEKELQHQS